MAYPDGATVLAELARDLGADTMRFAVQQFAQDADDLILRLAQRQAEGDGVGVQRAAHALKGLLRQFGAPALAEAAAALDRNPEAGTPAAEALVQRLQQELPGVVAHIESMAQELSGAAG